MYLSEAAARAGRRNNFNLIRLLAALCVLLSHSFTLATGDPRTEPFEGLLGINLGSLAVVVFFVTSGFLVGGSLLTRGQPARFVASRFTRIFPGLIVVVALTAVVVGPLVTTLSLKTYATTLETWRYMLLNGSSIFKGSMNLPGVFMTNPYPGTINGSLWTLRFELWMYAILLVAWLATAGRGRPNAFAVAVALIVALGFAQYWRHPELAPSAVSMTEKLGWFTPMFFLGVGAHIARARIALRWDLAALALLALLASAAAGPLYFKVAYPFCLTYLVLFIVYAMPLVEWIQHRDYSYGIYIYGFVVQQLLAWSVPHISVVAMAAASFSITTVLAAGSWHFIEKPALGSVDRITCALRVARRRIVPERARAA